MSFTKNLKKMFVCGTSLLLITSLGTGITNVSAHRTHRYHYRYSRQVRSNQRKYNSVVRYLRWVRRYDLTHKKSHTSWELRHINRYITGFNYGQKRYVYKIIKGLSYHAKRSYKHVPKRNKQVRKRAKVKNYKHHKSHKSAHNTIANVADLEKPSGKNVQPTNTGKHVSQTNNSQPAVINTNVPVVTPAAPVSHTNSTGNNQSNYQPQSTPIIHHQVTPVINNNGNNTDENLSQMKSQSLIDVNNDRQANGLPALKADPRLETYAGIRAQELLTDYEHSYNPSDFTRSGMSVNQPLWENIDLDHLHNDRQYGDPVTYHSNNGVDMANESNDIFMNHDQAEDNGHRDNILSPDVTTIGIGAAQSDGIYSLSEDMSNY